MFRWWLLAILLLGIAGLGLGLYFMLAANADNEGRLLLRQLRPDILSEQELKDNLRGKHPVLDPGKQSRYQLYVTPQDSAVQALAATVSGAEECYQAAVGWTWVSDSTLHGTSEKWLTPGEFLSDTPGYPGNPVPPAVVSDCEEQANTLVSLLRAEGISAINVRVVLGKVDFGGEAGGHAWVQVRHNGRWMELEATSGPYWDDAQAKWFDRKGSPFEYYAGHDYPQVEVWAYYNDLYYYDPRDGSGNPPATWRQPFQLK